MNYLSAEIEKLFKERNTYLKDGMSALRLFKTSFPSNNILQLVAKRDIHRAIEINSKIVELKKQEQEFLDMFNGSTMGSSTSNET